MSFSFTVLGVGVAAFGPAIGLNADQLSRIAAIAMIGFGIILLVPGLNQRFALATSGFSSRADGSMGGLRAQFEKW